MPYVVIVLLFGIVSYYFLKPYLKIGEKRFSLLKLFLIMLPTSIVFYWFVAYFIHYDKPDSFEYGMQSLEKNPFIRDKIGDYESYAYYSQDLPNKKDNPANFKVSLKGSLGTIYLSCKIRKDNGGNWHFIKIHQDSLIKNKDI